MLSNNGSAENVFSGFDRSVWFEFYDAILIFCVFLLYETAVVTSCKIYTFLFRKVLYKLRSYYVTAQL